MRPPWLSLILCSVAACADPTGADPESASRLDACGPDSSGLERIDLTAAPPAAPDGTPDLDAPSSEVFAGITCDCGDPQCLAEWIDEELGCGVCAHLRCGGTTTAACVRCDPSADDDPWCVMPPVDDVAR